MRCKQGDLAVIIKADDIENIGKLVEVVKYNSRDEDGYDLWNCKSAGGKLMGQEVSVSTGEVVREHGKGMTAIIPDMWLRPIRPGELDDETENICELEAV